MSSVNTNISIVVDSSCCLPESILNHYQIKIVYYSLIINDKIYKDILEIKPEMEPILRITPPFCFFILFIFFLKLCGISQCDSRRRGLTHITEPLCYYNDTNVILFPHRPL